MKISLKGNAKMLFEYISLFLGIIKIYIYKLFYINRLSFKGLMKCNASLNITTKKDSKILIGKCFRSRNRVNLRVYGGMLKVDDNCFLNDNVSINCIEKITIGKNFKAGHNVIIIDHDHDYKNNIEDFCSDEIIIGNNVWIGANSMVLKGSKIEDNCVIAAGSIIKGNVKKNSIVVQKRENSVRSI